MAKADDLVAPYIRVYSELVENDEEYLKGVEEFIAIQESFWSDATFKNFLCSPAVPKTQREKVIREALVKAEVSETVINTLVLMVRKGRQLLLSEFVRGLREYADKRCDILRGRVESAVEMDDDHKNQLVDVLKKATAKKIELQYHVREQLLGGLRVHLGQRVIDNSLLKKLGNAKQKLIQQRA